MKRTTRTISSEKTSVAGLEQPVSTEHASDSKVCNGQRRRSGLLIINADDWGRDQITTDRILDCLIRQRVSSVSAMLFMQDSKRAALIARERGIDAGLHLNFTTDFTGSNVSRRLIQNLDRIAAYLRRRRLNQIVFHPGLRHSFEYVVTAQRDEFCRLYGAEAERIDGHHHMHLCANVVLGRLLPPGTVVRRNFSFQRGEKSLVNRVYRQAIDLALARRHRIVDFLFSLPPFEPQSRLHRIWSLARKFVVEVETHPADAADYRFLTGADVARLTAEVPIASCFAIGRSA